MTTFIKKKLKDREGNYLVTPSSADIVYCSDGETVATKLRKVENDEFSPTITQMSSVSKVGVGEDIDISDNTQEGYLKSAILKGQTLVNLVNQENQIYSLTADGSYKMIQIPLRYDITDTTKKFFLSYRVVTNTIEPQYTNFGLFATEKYNNCGLNSTLTGGKIGQQLLIQQLSKSANHLRIYINNNVPSGTLAVTDIMLIEYQEGMENWDIPYFEGMQSVKMPVLTTTGKNLILRQIFNDDNSLNIYTGVNDITSVVIEGNRMICQGNIDNQLRFRFKGLRLEEGKTYVFSYSNAYMIDTSTGQTEQTYVGMGTDSILKPTSTKFGNIAFSKPSSIQKSKYVQLIIEDFQLEEGTVATTYEPYKSNILSASEDVTLCGIGKVRDELDLLTGEVVQNIGEIMLDGSESWGEYASQELTNTRLFYCGVPTNSNINTSKFTMINNRFASLNPNSGGLWNTDVVGLGHGVVNNAFRLRVLKSTANTISELKEYLHSNPIVVQYELAEKSIKTVDLTPGGTNPTTKPYVWDDGHIQLSSEEGSLTPSLEYSVTTSRGGQILDNTRQIAKQDKRVYDLEMLLINASIDEAYKRLSLQNDVMVMNGECQTVPSPLRYIMLQRLIEEKAYETQDMLDKLDVFFMYGEITDEQYFELFDIVLGVMTDTDLDITEEVE